jgi:hypothetical protein
MIVLQGECGKIQCDKVECDKVRCDTAPPPPLAEGKAAPPVAIVENDETLPEQAHSVKEYFP